MNRSILGIAIMVIGLGIATGAAIWKTKQEVEARTADRWRGNDSTAWVEKAAEWNPTLRLPNPTDISEGREPVRPIREAARHVGDSDLMASWHSEPADMVWKTRNGPTEDGEAFAERAGQDFTSMLRVFPRR